jgi:flavin reductase (DIM6/NTAB) family NADH-FMN oxidoreductase RutF
MMGMRSIDTKHAHRLLSPRVAYLVGAGSGENANVIPASNVTSISTDPELLGVGIYHEWSMVDKIRTGGGFTLSLPSYEDLELLWKLGATYSHYHGDGSGGKMREFESRLDIVWSERGPVLNNALGQLQCKVEQELRDLGDHIWFVASVERFVADERYLNEEALPETKYHPVMQVVGNWMTTAAGFRQLDFFE